MFVVAYYNCLPCLVLIQQHKTFLLIIHRKVSPVTLKIPLLNNNDYEPNVMKNMNSLFIDHNLSAITKLYVPPHDPSKWQFFAMLPWKPVYLSLPRASLRKTALARQYFYAGKIQSSLWELEENYSVFTKSITLNTDTPFIQTLPIPRQCLC